MILMLNYTAISQKISDQKNKACFNTRFKSLVVVLHFLFFLNGVQVKYIFFDLNVGKSLKCYFFIF